MGRDVGTMFRDPADPRTCRVLWGTFYGTAGVTVDRNDGNTMDPCRDVVALARAVHDYLPTRPDEMRRSS